MNKQQVNQPPAAVNKNAVEKPDNLAENHGILFMIIEENLSRRSRLSESTVTVPFGSSLNLLKCKYAAAARTIIELRFASTL